MGNLNGRGSRTLRYWASDARLSQAAHLARERDRERGRERERERELGKAGVNINGA
jgi:hypothetical protein